MRREARVNTFPMFLPILLTPFASSLLLGARMRLVVNCGQLIQVQMRITLRRRQAGVAEQFLDHSQISAAVKQMGGKAMTQTMRSHFDWNARKL